MSDRDDRSIWPWIFIGQMWFVIILVLTNDDDERSDLRFTAAVDWVTDKITLLAPLFAGLVLGLAVMAIVRYVRAFRRTTKPENGA